MSKLQEREVWQYFTLPVVTKIRNKLSSLIVLDMKQPSGVVSGPRQAMIGFVQGICQEAGIGAAEVFPELASKSHGETEKTLKAIEQKEAKEAEDSLDIEFDDKLHAIEILGLPDEEEDCLKMKKKDIIATIYDEDSDKKANDKKVAARGFLGLPKKAKKCNANYTQEKLVEFLYSEDE